MVDAVVDPTTGRPDVVAARSRMRTRQGARATIAWLSDRLEPDDVLTHLARSRALDGHTHDGPGVVGLTLRHLIHVPDTLERAAVIRLPLEAVVAVGRTHGRRVGDLSVATRRSTWEFRGLAAGDLREMVEALDVLLARPGTTLDAPDPVGLSPVR